MGGDNRQRVSRYGLAAAAGAALMGGHDGARRHHPLR